MIAHRFACSAGLSTRFARIGPTLALGFVCALACALSLAVACLPHAAAFAVTSEDDLVLGTSIAERGTPLEQAPDLDASFAALMDEDGTLWFGRGAADQAQIASLTKIMTALVAVEHLDAAATIEVTPTAASIGESSAGLVEGDTMTFDDALKAVLTASGNDAAAAVAQAAGARLLEKQGASGDAQACEAAFVEAMNAKARDLDLANSLFTNPHGLDFDAFAQGQHSCAQDVAAMLRAAMQHDLIRANIGYAQVDIVVQRGGVPTALTLTNTDALLGSYAGTCAAKTGYTLAAGPCSASAVNRGDGHEYYAVVLGSSSKPQRFADAEALYDWVFAHRAALEDEAEAQPEERESAPPQVDEETYQLVNATSSTKTEIAGTEASYPVVAKVAHGDWTDRTVEATVADPYAAVTVAAGSERIEQEVAFADVHGDVRRGDVVGRMTFRQGGTVLWEADLVAIRDAAAPAWWEALGVGVQRLFANLTGTPTVAASSVEALGAMKVS